MLEALHQDQGVDGLSALADAMRGLGPTYRSHGELMQVALRDRILIHVLEKLEKGVS